MLLYKKLDKRAKEPRRAHEGDAGLDLYALEDGRIEASDVVVVRTGIAISMPPGYVGMIKGRSSIAAAGVDVFGGVIDSTYTGEIRIVLYNSDKTCFIIRTSVPVAQLIIIPVLITGLRLMEELPETERGEQGFGSTDAVIEEAAEGLYFRLPTLLNDEC